MRAVGLLAVAWLCACGAAQQSTPLSEAETPTSSAAAVSASSGDDPCTAALPTAAGAEFAGVVRHVIDGDGLCVGPAEGDGSTWIEVRLMDFDAPEHNQSGGAEAAEALSRLASGRAVECVVTPGRSDTRSWDRTHAVCRLDGAPLGDLLRAAGVAEGGN